MVVVISITKDLSAQGTGIPLYFVHNRYPATTVVTLLQEVSQVASCAPKIDWKKLVGRTATGITSAREYQMLWRHLAYRDKLLEKIEENAEPLVCSFISSLIDL